MAAPYPSLTLGVLGAVAALRAAELAFSALALRAGRRAGRARALPEPAFPWLVAVHAGWLLGCLVEGLGFPSRLPPALLALAGALWAASLLLRAWLMASLGRLWNVRIVARPEQPIVTAGPYAWVRHPNYLAVVLEIAAVPLLVGALGTALLGSLANALLLYFRIRAEEAYLFAQPGYSAAFAGKKRFLPGLF
jgi:methyltransferase